MAENVIGILVGVTDEAHWKEFVDHVNRAAVEFRLTVRPRDFEVSTLENRSVVDVSDMVKEVLRLRMADQRY